MVLQDYTILSMLGITGKRKNTKPELYKLAQLLLNVPVTQV